MVHEYVTNSADACEEAGILPSIRVELSEKGEDRYLVSVTDNGPGIPRNYVGKALATILAGTKFHRYVQQRGRRPGAAGLHALLPDDDGQAGVCQVLDRHGEGILVQHNDTAKNRPIVSDMEVRLL